MRSFFFSPAYWTLSIVYSLMALAGTLLPGRKPVGWVIHRYTVRMIQAMKLFAGIDVVYRGRENIPARPVIYACKHQSWGDGFCIYSLIPDLAFVTGDHLEKYPLMSTLLTKLGAIVVNSCGGMEARRELASRSADAARNGRSILIYPEGHLSAPGTYHRYRSGVWHMMNSFDMPVVPVATNLGLFWQQERYEKKPGTAVLEFLEPILPGMDKAAFLTLLRDRIEARSQELIAEATGTAVTPSRPVD
ncbi:MAG: lysophospholipid acyltransferase family protein [Asticcacaulis sp.]